MTQRSRDWLKRASPDAIVAAMKRGELDMLLSGGNPDDAEGDPPVDQLGVTALAAMDADAIRSAFREGRLQRLLGADASPRVRGGRAA